MTDAMDLVFGANPERPNTPDLWRISEVLLRNDGAVDAAAGPDKEKVFKEITSGVVDIPSVLFMCEQRVRRAFGPITSPEEVPIRARLVSLVLDSFITGAHFQAAGGHRENFKED